MISLLVFLCIAYGGAVLAVTLPYWYELGNTACEDIPTQPISPRQVLKLWAEAAWSALLLGLAFPLDPVFRHCEKQEKTETGSLPPVLLIHGLYHNPSGWLYLRRQLRKAGFRKIHAMSYSSWKTNIAAVTAQVENAVRNLEHRYTGEKPVLIGHSLGGLLIRNWLLKEENQKRVFGAITLGAPHRGSKMAAVAFGALGQSLLPANPFFDDLAKTESAATIPCVSLVSEADTMVLPQKNLVPVTRGWAMRIAPYSTHAGIMVKGAVLRMVAWELHRMVNDFTANSGLRQKSAETRQEPATAPPSAAPQTSLAEVLADSEPSGSEVPVKTGAAEKTTAPKKPTKPPALKNPASVKNAGGREKPKSAASPAAKKTKQKKK